MAFSVISTIEGSRVLLRKASNLMSFGSNRPEIIDNVIDILFLGILHKAT